MNRTDILQTINEYFVNDELSSKQNVVELMNLKVEENIHLSIFV